jgi:superfamily II DNA or RNA helicase
LVLFRFWMPDSKQSLEITRAFLLEIGGWRTMKEAESLLEAGRVEEVTLEPPLLKGLVRTGTSHVKARLHIGSRLSEVENLCSCRQAREYGTICPHVVALGLAYLQKNGRGSQETPTSHGEGAANGTPSPIQEPDPNKQLRYIPASESADEARHLHLTVTLPPKLEQSWRSGQLQVVVQASVNGGETKPVSRFFNGGHEPYAVSEADESFLDFMKSRVEDGIADIWQMPAKNVGDMLHALTGHPNVFIGKEKRIEIRPREERSTLKVNLAEDGSLVLQLADAANGAGEVLQCKTGQWWLQEDCLEELNGLPLSYLGLRGKERVVPREQIAHFFQHEMSYLERQARVELAPECAELEFIRIQPDIEVVLDGMLSGISCKAVARYGTDSYAIQGADTIEVVEVEQWKPDPDHPRRYLIRDRATENKVRRRILEVGFQPGKRLPEQYTLSPENRVGDFLANTLPYWKRIWNVDYSPRMSKLMNNCDLIEPEITVHENDTDNNWLSMGIDFREEQGNSRLSHGEVHELLRKGHNHQRMSNGRIALLPGRAVDEFHELLKDCQVKQTQDAIKIHRRYAGYLGQALSKNNWKFDQRSSWQPPTRLNQFETIQLSDHMESRLRPYQKMGTSWLHYLSGNELHGILADEMGLGKTIQTLAYLEYRQAQGLTTEPTLIVCPTSLVMNWRDEAERFSPGLKVLALQGPGRKKLFSKICDHDVVVTSYALLRRDLEIYRERVFDYVILDEAQFIKNRSSQNAKSVKALKAENRLVLTGTPIENSLLDLWSIFDFLMPGYLGSAKDFKTRYETPLSKDRAPWTRRRLKQRVRPFILRRTKAEVVKDLPAKLEQITYCDLTKEQKAVYQELLSKGRQMVFDHAGKNGLEKRRMAVLNMLMRLRQVCCHLHLLPTREKKKWKQPSTKLDHFMELLEQAVDGEHRVLVYSQFVSMLKLVAASLDEKEVKYCYLDGSTIDRKGEVKRFQENSEIPVFLISLKAGGTGLNLTGADTVVHFDPWWNPAVEDQATARAHRIGQTRVVNSYKLIARGTVEEKIVELQQKKKELVSHTLISEETMLRHLTWDDLQNLLSE